MSYKKKYLCMIGAITVIITVVLLGEKPEKFRRIHANLEILFIFLMKCLNHSNISLMKWFRKIETNFWRNLMSNSKEELNVEDSIY